MKLRLRYLIEDMDRHGNVRVYVRIKGRPKVRMQHPFGTEAFMAEYHDAVAGKIKPRSRSKPNKPEPGTLRAGAIEYFGSLEFRQLHKDTRRVRRNIIEAACVKSGDIPLRQITSATIAKNRDKRLETPAAANNFLKAMSGLFKYLAEQRLVDRNPVVGVKRLKSANPDGFHTWSVEEIRKFEERHPRGSQARLALSLLMFTGCRRSDVVRLGRQHIRDGGLHFVAAKNEDRKPVEIDIPLLEPLAQAIAEGPTGDLTFLVTQSGKPFSKDGFGNKFRRWCRQAGLPHCSAHGLRKAAATIAADNNATESALNAIFGWSDPDMAQHYTRKANRKRLAAESMDKLIPGQSGNKVSHFQDAVSESGTKTEEKDRKINGRGR